MPLQTIKGIGKSIYGNILKEREKGPFKNYLDCVVRLNAIKVNEGILNVLIDGGAFDGFEYNRITMKHSLKDAINYAGIISTQTSDGVLFNYDLVSAPLITRLKENRMEKSQKEYEAFGFYLSLHPVQELRQYYPRSVPLKHIEEVNGYCDVLGKVVSYRTHKTKNGAWMCFMSIEDENAKLDVVIMPDLYAKEKEKIVQNAIVYISGKKDRPQSILARNMKWIEMKEF